MMEKNCYNIVPWSKEVEKNGLALLEKYQTTSMFLLSNLKECGSRMGEVHYSGNFKCLLKNNQLVAVFCLSKDGNALIQTDRAEDYSPYILPACLDEGIFIKGCVAEWSLAASFWQFYNSQFPVVKTTTYSREILYSLALSHSNHKDSTVRFLNKDDFHRWEPLNTEYFKEMHFPEQGTKDQRRIAFNAKAKNHYWWGLFEGDRLISIAAYNARVDTIAQIGGVYTQPDYRKKGYASRTLQSLIAESYAVHGLETLLLFTDENNLPARALYERLGFQETGNFGLIFGEKA
jgi:uncharacterized protein